MSAPTLIICCAWCGQTQGAKPDPLGFGGVTSTICDACMARVCPEEE